MDEKKQAQIEAGADLAWGQGLWYAWGRLDSGQYRGMKLKNPLDAFTFADTVRANQLAFNSGETISNESIQGQWDKYVAKESS